MSDSDDFEAMMATLGVVPLGGERAAAARKGKPLRGVERPPAAAPKPKAPEPPPPPVRSPLEEERDGLRVRVGTLEAELEGLRAELASLRPRVSAAEAEAREAREAREAAEQDRQREQFDRVTAEEAVDRLRDRLRTDRQGRRDTQRELEQTQGELRAVQADLQDRATASVREALRERGCADLEEEQTVLGALLTRRPDELLAALVAGAELAPLLEDRVQLLCGRPTCPQDPQCVMLLVPAERCESCGGSDTRAAFGQLARLAEERGGLTLTIVGGSPAYRKQLRELLDGRRALRVELVPGTQRRPKSKAEADLRRSDRVVLWGATMLDHAVTDAYAGGPKDKLLRVPHRGIGTMLRALVDALG